MDKSPALSRQQETMAWRPLSEWRKENVFSLRRKSSENNASGSEVTENVSENLGKPEWSNEGNLFDAKTKWLDAKTLIQQSRHGIAETNDVYQLHKDLMEQTEQLKTQIHKINTDNHYTQTQLKYFDQTPEQSNRPQHPTGSFPKGLDGKIDKDLFLQCQRHLDVIGAYTELQQTIKGEMTKQARLDNTIYQKMTAKAERLSQTALKLQETPDLEWTCHALGDLGAHVNQQAQAHRVYMSLLNNQCLAIQRSLDGHLELMKNTRQNNNISDPPAKHERADDSQKSGIDDGDSQNMSFLQATNVFEGVRKPRMILVNKMDYLESQQQTTLEELSQLEASILDLSTSQQTDMLQWQLRHKLKDTQSRKDFLEIRKEQIQADLKSVRMELHDFDFNKRDQLLEVLNVFRQHRVRFDTTLRKSFQLLKAVSLRETDTLRDFVRKSRNSTDEEQATAHRAYPLLQNTDRSREISMKENRHDFDSRTHSQNKGRPSKFPTQGAKEFSPSVQNTNPFLTVIGETEMPGKNTSFNLWTSPDFSPSDESGTESKTATFENQTEEDKEVSSSPTHLLHAEPTVSITDSNFSRADNTSMAGESHNVPQLSSQCHSETKEKNEKKNSKDSHVQPRDMKRIKVRFERCEGDNEKAIISKYMDDTDFLNDHHILTTSQAGQRISLANYGYKAYDVEDLIQLARIEEEMKALGKEDKAIGLINKYVCHRNKHAPLSKNSNNCEPVPLHVQQTTEKLGHEDCLDFEAFHASPTEPKTFKKVSDSVHQLLPLNQARDLKVCTVKPISSLNETEATNPNLKVCGPSKCPEIEKNTSKIFPSKQNSQCGSDIGQEWAVVELQLYEVTAGKFLSPKEDGKDLVKVMETRKTGADDCSNNRHSVRKGESYPNSARIMKTCEISDVAHIIHKSELTENCDRWDRKQNVSLNEKSMFDVIPTKTKQVRVLEGSQSFESKKYKLSNRLPDETDETVPKTLYYNEHNVHGPHCYTYQNTFNRQGDLPKEKKIHQKPENQQAPPTIPIFLQHGNSFEFRDTEKQLEAVKGKGILQYTDITQSGLISPTDTVNDTLNHTDAINNSQNDAGFSKTTTMTTGTAENSTTAQLNTHPNSVSQSTDLSGLDQMWENKYLVKSDHKLGACPSIRSLEDDKACVQNKRQNEKDVAMDAKTVNTDPVDRPPLFRARYGYESQTLTPDDLYPQQSASVKQGKTSKKVRFDDRVQYDDNTETVYTHHMHCVTVQTLDTSTGTSDLLEHSTPYSRTVNLHQSNVTPAHKGEPQCGFNTNYSNNTMCQIQGLKM